MPKIESLLALSVKAISKNINMLEEIGDVPRELLEEVFAKCTWKQLAKLEHFNEHLICDNEELWMKHGKEQFPKKIEEKVFFATWREFFMACKQEKEDMLLQARAVYREKILQEDREKKSRKIQIVDATQANIVDSRERKLLADRQKEKDKELIARHSPEWLKFLKSTGASIKPVRSSSFQTSAKKTTSLLDQPHLNLKTAVRRDPPPRPPKPEHRPPQPVPAKKALPLDSAPPPPPAAPVVPERDSFLDFFYEKKERKRSIEGGHQQPDRAAKTPKSDPAITQRSTSAVTSSSFTPAPSRNPDNALRKTQSEFTPRGTTHSPSMSPPRSSPIHSSSMSPPRSMALDSPVSRHSSSASPPSGLPEVFPRSASASATKRSHSSDHKLSNPKIASPQISPTGLLHNPSGADFSPKRTESGEVDFMDFFFGNTKSRS